MENTLFSVYNICIMHPNNWEIFINTTRPFKFNNGFVKIDSSSIQTDIKSDCSMTLRWIQNDNINSIDDYIQELQMQYCKKTKKNKTDSYEILDIDNINLMHKAFYIHSRIKSNHSPFRILRNDENFDSMQVAVFCHDTNRLIIQTINAETNHIKNYEPYYKDLLFQLKCH